MHDVLRHSLPGAPSLIHQHPQLEQPVSPSPPTCGIRTNGTGSLLGHLAIQAVGCLPVASRTLRDLEASLVSVSGRLMLGDRTQGRDLGGISAGHG